LAWPKNQVKNEPPRLGSRLASFCSTGCVKSSILSTDAKTAAHRDFGVSVAPTSVRRRALARVARARLLGRQQHRHYTGGRSERGDVGEHPDEAPLLTLDAMRAHAILGWQPLLPFNEALTWTADWYRAFWDDKDIAVFTRRQIDVFSDRLARPAGERMTLRGTA
jgi:hypothetical protein